VLLWCIAVIETPLKCFADSVFVCVHAPLSSISIYATQAMRRKKNMQTCTQRTQAAADASDGTVKNAKIAAVSFVVLDGNRPLCCSDTSNVNVRRRLPTHRKRVFRQTFIAERGKDVSAYTDDMICSSCLSCLYRRWHRTSCESDYATYCNICNRP